MIDTGPICDVERKINEKDNNKKDSGAKRKASKKDKDKDKDKDNLIDKLIIDKDKLHNFSDKVLNDLTNIAKLKEKILIEKSQGN